MTSDGHSLLDWSHRDGRIFPWRVAPDKYPLAAAEILLQKTRAADAEPVWTILLARYPEPALLADAPAADLIDLVGRLGLGEQRVSRLRKMAIAVREGAPRLPGIGPYGAAVLALSAGKTPLEPPVDGNIARVVSRLDGLSFARGEPRKKAAVRGRVASLMASVGGPRLQLQLLYALVDLGATVCTPHAPVCGSCPLAPSCKFARDGANV